NAQVRAMITWDPDGDGPLGRELLAAGYFTTAGGVTVNRVARWDGSAWRAFGAGIDDGRIHALAAWDPDGPGPAGLEIVAGGACNRAGGVFVNGIARWDGSVWQALGSGVVGYVDALTTWDPDGDGPLDTQLIAGGFFNFAGNVPAANIARWDGSTWHSLGD